MDTYHVILQLSQNPKHINKQKQNHNYRGQTGGLQRVEDQEGWAKQVKKIKRYKFPVIK